jgi:hypothetical protein
MLGGMFMGGCVGLSCTGNKMELFCVITGWLFIILVKIGWLAGILIYNGNKMFE